MLKKRNVQMKKAVNFLKELSADPETRKRFEDREKARRDMASRLDGAKREGKEGGKKEERMEVLDLLDKGYSMDEIRQILC